MSTILVVDDEIPFLKMMDVNLRRRGCHVQAVTTCDEAMRCQILRHRRTHPPRSLPPSRCVA
jgi:ActR/RegA family two-component response regulator